MTSTGGCFANGSEMPTFIIRCDGSSTIGMGHVMRCIALATSLRELGCRVVFVVRKLTGDTSTALRANDFEYRVAYAAPTAPEVPDVTDAHDASDAPDGRLSDEDLHFTLGTARDEHVDCVVVDHYAAREGYLAAVRAAGFTLGVIDDTADRDLSAADWLLNQNLGADSLAYRTSSDCVRRLGPSFALLRPEYDSARAGLTRTFAPTDDRVLITLGGGDSADLTVAVLSALDTLPGRLTIRCIVTDRRIVTDRSDGAPAFVTAKGGGRGDVGRNHFGQGSKHQVTSFGYQTDLASHMAWADVAIGAGGSTCWELCCMGVPMIVCGLSDDQSGNVMALEQAGIAVSVGSWYADTGTGMGTGAPHAIADRLAALINDPNRRATMSETGMNLVDGHGAARAAESLLACIHTTAEAR